MKEVLQLSPIYFVSLWMLCFNCVYFLSCVGVSVLWCLFLMVSWSGIVSFLKIFTCFSSPSELSCKHIQRSNLWLFDKYHCCMGCNNYETGIFILIILCFMYAELGYTLF